MKANPVMRYLAGIIPVHQPKCFTECFKFYRNKPLILEAFYSDLISLPSPEAKIGENQKVNIKCRTFNLRRMKKRLVFHNHGWTNSKSYICHIIHVIFLL